MRLSFHASFSQHSQLLTETFNLGAKSSDHHFWEGGYDFRLSELILLTELFNCTMQEILTGEF